MKKISAGFDDFVISYQLREGQRYLLRRSHSTCGPVYRYTISHFSSWKFHGITMRMSPSRIQTFFLIFPLILPILVTPSKQRIRIWFAPIISSAHPNISRLRFWGSLTLTISSPGGTPGFFSVSTTSPLPTDFMDFVRLIVGARENIFIPSPIAGIPAHYIPLAFPASARTILRNITAPTQTMKKPEARLIRTKLPVLIRDLTEPITPHIMIHHATEPARNPPTNSTAANSVVPPITKPKPGRVTIRKMMVSGFAIAIATIER